MNQKRYAEEQAESYINSYQKTKACLLHKKENAILNILNMQASSSLTEEKSVEMDTNDMPPNGLYFDFGSEKMPIPDNSQIKNQETVINRNIPS